MIFEIGNRVIVKDTDSFLYGKKGQIKKVDLSYVHVQLDKSFSVVIHESRVKKLKKR